LNFHFKFKSSIPAKYYGMAWNKKTLPRITCVSGTQHIILIFKGLLCFNATFNNISVITQKKLVGGKHWLTGRKQK